MVADDSPMICALLEHVLSEHYEVFSAENGLEVLDWLKAGNKPDAIVSDIDMPYMDGFELLQNLRTSQFSRHIPVMMLSGLESSEERIRSFELGADDYLLKPFNPKELQVRVASLLKRTHHAGY